MTKLEKKKKKQQTRYFLRQDKRRGYKLKQQYYNSIFSEDIDTILGNVDTTCYDNYAGLSDEAITDIKNYCRLDQNCNVMCGASRYIISPFNLDYIAKINFPCYCEDEEAREQNFCMNYNLVEIELRQKIIRAYPQLSKIFLPLYKIDDEICLQEKIIVMEKCNFLPEKEQILNDNTFLSFCANIDKNKDIDTKLEDNDELFNYLCDKVFNESSATWWYYVYYYYGEKVVKDILKAQDNFDIEDIHEGNVGFTMKKEPVIFDYVGFYE